MTNRRWTTFEYCWRFGVRPLMWLVRSAVFCWAIAAASWVAKVGTDAGVFAVLIAYGIWEIGRAIRSISHTTVNVARGEKLIVQRGATVSVPKQDIDRLLASIAEQEARKAA